MARPAHPLSSNQPDVHILTVLSVVQRLCLIAIVAVAGTVLCAWLIPPMRVFLPADWALMKANMAVLALLCAWSIVLSQPRSSARTVLAGRALGAVVALLSTATLCQYLFSISLGMDTLLAADAQSSLPGRMAVQTALSFFLLGIVLLNLRVRKRALAYLIDGIVLCLALLMLIFIAGYAYGALGLFGLTMQHRLSPQTLFCCVLLTFLVFNRRTEYGIFSIMIDAGIGGKTARLAAPCAILLPFVMATIRGLVTRFNLVTEQYGIAFAGALMALISLCFILFLSSRCKRLENDIRELSIRDELTQLYNRRGFYLLAEQGLRLAYRAREVFFLIFIDVDNLKHTNDHLGHEVGSGLLQELASLLQNTFRETDVIARLGGDEFVVAGKGGPEKIMTTLTRLEQAAFAYNAVPSRPYPLSFSLGYVTADRDSAETLEELLQRADSIMYEAKRTKKLQHEPLVETATLAPIHL
jgi:diguanylate cyclase (GGDEF)-like protein